MDPVQPAQSAGQVSADGQFRWDGQQWVPLGAGYREPTPWTRPMQQISAAYFAISAVYGLISTIVFINHDSVLKAIQAQGTQLPQGTDIDTIVNVTIGITWAIAIFFLVLEIVAAIGSYLGWRWIFWGALVLYGLSAIGALLNISSLFNPSRSPVPEAGLIVSELLALAGLAMFVWMIVAVIRFGPWAMKRPGR